MTYNTLYQWHMAHVICHWADLYMFHTRFSLFCTSVKRDIWCDGPRSDKPSLSINHSAPLSSRFEAWRANRF